MGMLLVSSFLANPPSRAMFALGTGHSIFLQDADAVTAVGTNTYGQLGLDDTVNRDAVTPLKGARSKNVAQIASGLEHVVFLYEDGTVRTVGRNNNGQLGDGTQIDKSTPAQINAANVKQVACGGSHTLLLYKNGTVQSCGANFFGQLGDGSVSDRRSLVDVKISGVKAVAAGASYSMFLMEDNTVLAVGYNYFGQLGNGNKTNTSDIVTTGFQNVRQIVCGASHTLCLHNDGTLSTVGFNSSGQLGTGDNVMSKTELQSLVFGREVKQVAAAGNQSFLLTAEGDVYGCGANTFGQLGIGSKTTQNVFTKAAVNNIRHIACGPNHTMFEAQGYETWGTGRNNMGQLGDNTKIDQVTPVSSQFRLI